MLPTTRGRPQETWKEALMKGCQVLGLVGLALIRGSRVIYEAKNNKTEKCVGPKRSQKDRDRPSGKQAYSQKKKITEIYRLLTSTYIAKLSIMNKPEMSPLLMHNLRNPPLHQLVKFASSNHQLESEIYPGTEIKSSNVTSASTVFCETTMVIMSPHIQQNK